MEYFSEYASTFYSRNRMLVLVLTTLFMFSTQVHSRQSVDSLSKAAATYFDNAKEEKALEGYLNVLEKDPEHYEALWHTALLYARIGYRKGSGESQKEYYKKALYHAEKTLDLYPDKGYPNFVYAVAQGRTADISDIDTRIEKSHAIGKHVKKAVELLPDYAPAWLLLGTWHSEIANVDPAKEMAAGVFSEGLPDGATNEKAVEYIKKAIELRPEKSIRFKLDLARHYERIGQKKQAVKILREVLEEEPADEIQKWNHERAKELLEKLS